jgi:hypothetical protein
MGLKNACFISYRHLPGHEDIFGELFKALINEIALWLTKPVYLDQERLKGGDFFNQGLATALCESACMITVYVPTYFEDNNPYCAREYKAMEKIESRRFRLLGTGTVKESGFIIPVVCRDWDNVPDEIRDKRQCYNFERILLRGKKLSRDPGARQEIFKIAQYIKARCDELDGAKTDPCKPWPNFKIPEEAETRDWLRSLKRANKSARRFPR